MTLRELNWMTHGRLEHDWNLVSQLLSAVASIGGEEIAPEKFNPYARRIRRPKRKISVEQLCKITGRIPVLKK